VSHLQRNGLVVHPQSGENVQNREDSTVKPPWAELFCPRLLEQATAGRKHMMLLPLPLIEPPVAGDSILVLMGPVRGYVFTIARVQFGQLGDLKSSHFEEIGLDRETYLRHWDESNPSRLAADNPCIMLLWLLPGQKNDQVGELHLAM